MIEFNGELSNECKRYIQYDGTKTVRISVSIVSALFSIPLIIATILWHWIFAISIPLPIIVAILVLVPKINSPMKILNLYFPKSLTIEDGIISIESEKVTEIRSIDDVKKVIDFGDWYHILFYFPHKSLYFVCQKNLITSGSIEEFENFFEGIIIVTKK